MACAQPPSGLWAYFFVVGTYHICASNAPLLMLCQATSVYITFKKHKNVVRGESIGHGCFGHKYACNVRCIFSMVE